MSSIKILSTKTIGFLSVVASFLFVVEMTIAQPLNENETLDNELEPGYYVVVGAFKVFDNAKRFTAFLKYNNHEGSYVYQDDNETYYVHLGFYESKVEAVNTVLKIRSIPLFSDAWVKHISTVSQTEDAYMNPANLSSIATATPDSTELSGKNNYDENLASDSKDEIVQYTKVTLGNTEVFLSLFNATNNRLVDGKVKVVDMERSKLIEEVQGNSYLYLPDPKSKSGQLSLISEVFGYRKIQHELNFNNPLTDSVQNFCELFGTSLIVKFDLTRYLKGDIATLYNVYFYSDAAIMMPESKYELQSLLQMLVENSNYRIRLHGHTNGNYFGKILRPGNKQSFFSIEGDVISKTGSSKELSFMRAQLIKDYLAQSGIDPSRIEIKAWGGKRPIYDKHHANAKRNIRVEVEILNE